MGLELALFYAFAVVAVGGSLLVIGQRSPIHSVMLLIVSFAALAGLYVLLDAPLVAVIQIIIYAGAIMVLFLFVVMLLNVPREPAAAASPWVPGPRRAGAALGGVLLVELVWAISRSVDGRGGTGLGAAAGRSLESVRTIGQVLYTDYSFAFEVTSLLILVAMVGAVVLAKRRV